MGRALMILPYVLITNEQRKYKLEAHKYRILVAFEELHFNVACMRMLSLVSEMSLGLARL